MRWKVARNDWGKKYQIRVGYKMASAEYLSFFSKEAATSALNAMRENPHVETLTLIEVKELELHYKA